MSQFHPDSYENDSVIKGLGMIQTCLQKYTTKAMPSEPCMPMQQIISFRKKAAMIANGPWMTPDFADTENTAEGFEAKVGVAAYPESGLIEQYEVGYTLCTAGKDEKVQEAALEFLKFKTGKMCTGNLPGR